MDTRPFVCKLRLHLPRLPDCVCSILLIFEELIRSRFALTRPEINDASFILNLTVSPAARSVKSLPKVLYKDLRYSTSSPACLSVSPKEKCLL